MSQILSNIENIPFYDYFVDKWNDYAGEHFQTKDPYVEELPNGKTRKLKLPNYCSKEDQKAYKHIQRKAWIHDKCFLGCYPIDCGVGLAPIVSLLPAIGPIVMYAVHSRLIHYADQRYHLGAKTVAKLELNIMFDLLITLPPIIGSLLSFLNGCSTRNAAIIYNTVSKRAYQNYQQTLGHEPQLNHQDPFEEEEMYNPHQQQQYQQQQQPAQQNKFEKFFSNFDNIQLNEKATMTRQQQSSGIYHN